MLSGFPTKKITTDLAECFFAMSIPRLIHLQSAHGGYCKNLEFAPIGLPEGNSVSMPQQILKKKKPKKVVDKGRACSGSSASAS